jgi:EAL domain-containing protein (putative c-di-GMP-specific phosphodiesterase class I)
MKRPAGPTTPHCAHCADGAALDFDFSMAFQPIVDLERGEIFAYEALARGPNGEPAGEVFKHVDDDNRYRFDQTCRVKAIELAARLGLTAGLSINFMPNAVYRPELCIRSTLEAAQRFDFPVERIIFEITEGEQVGDHGHLRGIIRHYQERGFRTAIDDFGAGFSGLNLLAEFQTDLVKLDMMLLRSIDTDSIRQSIVKGILQVCDELSITVIAEGIETREELTCLRRLGIGLFQGYYLARPGFEALPQVPPERLASA